MLFGSKTVQGLKTQVGNLELNNYELKELLHIERNLNDSLKSDLSKETPEYSHFNEVSGR